jgi:uncharacterized damage-inducible protein DinB
MSDLVRLIDTYLEGPKLLREAVRGMTRDQLLARPVAGKMSTLEVVCHVADFEPILADRIKRILTHDRPTLLGADENLFTAGLAYQQRDLGEELALIDATRAQLARILRTLTPNVLTRVGVHSERGEMTLERILTMACNHIPHHLPFIAEKKKALGVAG